MAEEKKLMANIPPFGLRMQPDLKTKVEDAAKANNRSINAEIVHRLEASFARVVDDDTTQVLEWPDGVSEEALSEAMEVASREAVRATFARLGFVRRELPSKRSK